MKTPTRSPKGGTIAQNGEFYTGGTFLPSTTNPKQTPATKYTPAKTGKRQIERYRWEVQPTPESRSIYSLIVGVFAVERDGVISRFEPGIGTYGETIQGLEVNTLIERWNSGDRWI